jgi:AhpD family alkylhydroperoxidase
MEARLNPYKAAPKAYQAMLTLSDYAASSGIEKPLQELIKIRASQINGCAYCLDMHTKDARAAGETEQRIYMLDAWRESALYTGRERAALEWTEALTKISEGHVPDDVYERVKQNFTPEELANLSIAIVTINAWNRLGIAFRIAAGRCQPATYTAKSAT